MSRTTLAGCDHPNKGHINPVFVSRDPLDDPSPTDCLTINVVAEDGTTIKEGLIFLIARGATELTLLFTGEQKLYSWWLVDSSGRHYNEVGEGAKAFLSK